MSNISKIKKNHENLLKSITYNQNNAQIVNPAFRWAQSKDFVFIEIKYSHKIDSPGKRLY